MHGLRRHIPETAIAWALDAPLSRCRAVDGTLCFADISGFTALAERLSKRGRIGGEELVETLSRVFGAMLERARDRDGVLLKFGGDALLFLFEGEDHALRAASTAVEMRSALRKAAEIPTSVGPLRLSMSVGLHSGTIHLFLVGETHRELVLAGRDASLAAATEAAANAGEIGVSAATAARLPASAVRPRDDGLLLLRWRRPPAPPAGASPQRPAEEALVRSLFPRRLGETLARGAPDPEHRVACIAFVRFSGTDALLEREGPEAVAAALQATVGTAQRILETEDVTLLAVDLDRDGGKLFLGSGVPQASEDDEGRMLRAMRRLADAGTPLPLQIGVNRGHVFAAEVGTPWRAAYSAMGDTTNTAARICAKAPPGELYAHPSVLVHARTKYATEAVGPFQFKGKKTPQAVYRVGEETGTRDAVDASMLPVVGRRAELATLLAAVDRLASGVGGVVCIQGATGMGKSRLLREALQRLSDVPTLQFRAELYGKDNPYRALRDPLRALLGIGRGEPASMQARLEAAIRRLDPGLVPLLPLLGEAVHLDLPPTEASAAVEPRFRPDRIADIVTRLLEAGQEGPRLVLVEDAHWMDGASAQLLKRLAAACASRPWLMVVARRDEAGGFTPQDGAMIDLGPLPDPDLAAFVNQAAASAPLRPHELALVVRRASGNPLYAEEIVRAARRVGSFEAVPDSLEAAIAAQVDALNPAARKVLRYATVLGRSFARANLDALLASEGIEPVDAMTLSSLEAFLEPDAEERLRFRIGLLRKTIYEELAFRLRTRLHRKAGEAIERLEADAASHADTLALHFSVAGEHAKAWRYAALAANRAARAYANAEAARLYRMALEAARRLPDLDPRELVQAWTERGHACRLAGMLTEALDCYRQATRLSGDDPVTRAGLFLWRGRTRERMGEFAASLRELAAGQQCLAGAEGAEAARMRARLSAFAAMARFGQERFEAALRQAEDAVREARTADEPSALAQALVAADSAHLSLGGSGTARLEEALTIYERLGDLSMTAMVRGNLGCGAFLEGRWDEALAWFEGGRESRLKAGDVVGAATAASNIGEILVKRGRLDEAWPLLTDVVRVMRASGFQDGAAYAEVQLGRLLIARGQHARADELLERVRGEFLQLGQPISALEAAAVQAQARTGCGQAREALELLADAEAAAGKGARMLAAQVAEARALALDALGRLDDARAAVSAGLVAARQNGLAYEEALLLALADALERRAGTEPPTDAITGARRIFEGLGVQWTPRPSVSIG
jgi:class 3 adenylate cyclase/tetratricopeptide (TPR) repeat protein